MTKKMFPRPRFVSVSPSLALQAGLVSIVIAGLTATRTSGQDSRPPSGEAVKEFERAVSSPETMYEDVEIFRRILDRKLEQMYPAPQADLGWGHSSVYPSYQRNILQPFTTQTPNYSIWEGYHELLLPLCVHGRLRRLRVQAHEQGSRPESAGESVDRAASDRPASAASR